MPLSVPSFLSHSSSEKIPKLCVWKYRGLSVLMITTLMMIILGGVTRLTDSGLSIVKWSLFMGMIPPMNQSAWQEVFASYQAYPEYQVLRSDMMLNEFKMIFLYEYAHRMLGRLIGLIMMTLGLWMLLKRALRRDEKFHFFNLFILVSLQGAVGWYMVRSGLSDNPHVSHFRLALHLLLALLFLSYTWVLMLIYRKHHIDTSQYRETTNQQEKWISLPWLYLAGLLLVIQITYGAFMAGLKAGFVSTTYPLMFGTFIPQVPLRYAYQQNGLASLINDSTWIHFIHRHLGILTSVALISLLVVSFRNRLQEKHDHHSDPFLNYGFTLTAIIAIIQPILGILTIIFYLPTLLALLHQLLAVMLLLSLLLLFFYRLYPRQSHHS